MITLASVRTTATLDEIEKFVPQEMKKGKIVIVIENLTNEIFWEPPFTNAEDLKNGLLFGTTLVGEERFVPVKFKM